MGAMRGVTAGVHPTCPRGGFPLRFGGGGCAGLLKQEAGRPQRPAGFNAGDPRIGLLIRRFAAGHASRVLYPCRGGGIRTRGLLVPKTRILPPHGEFSTVWAICRP
jgi:hypothetical protein